LLADFVETQRRDPCAVFPLIDLPNGTNVVVGIAHRFDHLVGQSVLNPNLAASVGLKPDFLLSLDQA
jgi:hypothetical protein